MEFASKWIMISEVTFDSSVARGNYSVESEADVREAEGAATAEAPMLKDQVAASPTDLKAASAATSGGSDNESAQSAFMPIVIGVLTAVILLLAAVIFFIVNKTRQRKQQFVQLPAHDQQGRYSVLL